MERIEAWTELAVEPEALEGICRALDEAGVDVEILRVGSVPRVEITFPDAWVKGKRTTLHLCIEEDSVHARERLNDEAGIAQSYTEAEGLWRE